MKSMQFTPVHFFILTFLGGVACSFIYELRVSSYISFEIMQISGIVFLLLALLINILSYKKFKHYKTPDAPFSRPKQLISDGVFRLSRNPVYLALIISQTALAFIFDTLYLFVTAFLLWLLLDIYIVSNEENVLLGEFEDEYEKYLQKTPRWF